MMRKISDDISVIIRSLKQIDGDILTSENIIMTLIQHKIPQQLLVEYQIMDVPKDTVDDLFSALETLISAREIAQLNDNHQKKEEKIKKRTMNTTFRSEKTNSKKTNCIFCKGTNHDTKNCTSPKTPASERFQMVLKERLCTYCLNPNHRKAECHLFKRTAITCKTCDSNSHHTLLHRDKKDWNNQKPTANKTQPGNNSGAVNRDPKPDSK